MDFNVFVEEIVDLLQERMGEDYDVTVTEVTKNNDVTLTGVVMMKKTENISPTIYLEEPYEEYQAGAKMEELIAKIVACYEERMPDANLNMDFFQDFEQVKNRIFYKLVNYEKNKKRLETLPHYKWKDLAIVFYYAMEQDVIGRAFIMIQHHHLEMWGQSADTLYSIAKQNMKQSMPELLISMKDFLADTAGVKLGKDTYMPMYILSNQEQMYGAAALLYSEQIKQLAESLQSDLIILPSSVHELLLLPDDGENEYTFYRQMVEDVNTTQVEPEEILSYSLYRYLREKEEVEEILA
jgi:hypothetical protein